MKRPRFMMWNGVCVVALLFAAALVLRPADGESSVAIKTPDGRFGSECYPWVGDTSRELCDVPFARLVARPEDYHGRLISITGFLVSDFGKLVMYPSKETYLAAAEIEGLELFTDSDLPEEIDLSIAEGAFPVYVIGVFDAKHAGGSIARFGALREIKSLVKVKRLRSE